MIILPLVLGFYLAAAAIGIAIVAVALAVCIVWGLGHLVRLAWRAARKKKRKGRPPPFHSQAQYSNRR